MSARKNHAARQACPRCGRERSVQNAAVLQLCSSCSSLEKHLSVYAPLRPWVADADCSQTDPETFFPDKGGTAVPAKEVCGGCDVRLECLRWALDNAVEFGIWGGLTPRERAALRKRKRRRGSATDDDPTTVRCKGTTAEGGRCRRVPSIGTDYCHYHRGTAAADTTTTQEAS